LGIPLGNTATSVDENIIMNIIVTGIAI